MFFSAKMIQALQVPDIAQAQLGAVEVDDGGDEKDPTEEEGENHGDAHRQVQPRLLLRQLHDG